MTPTKKEVPQPFSDTCIVVDGVFTEEECQEFISRLVEPLKIDTTTSEDLLRIVERTSLKDQELAERLYKRVKPICPARWRVTNEDPHLGPFAQGEWAISGVDHRIQLYRYTAGGVFNKHRDGPTYYSVNKRSLFTVLVYLNDTYKGGNTTVFTDDQTIDYKVPKKAGACFAMLQRMLHEGSRVEEGVKFALRCDVLYERVGGSAEESVQHLDKKEQAKKWFQLACKLELSGCVNECVAYYQKAYKLDPNLEETE
eukprot:Phypoly_transcript_15451.p1 GENE.Phypoly_transcript_15451~~Phypoly_transcript_15451.p1  ORF type:complete len:255 (+),score=41.94 Phypoly_transcript_15451:103-867(+)